MEKLKKRIFLAVLISETGHIFCCVLPTVFSILGILTGLGVLSAMPQGWVAVHDLMHRFEVPMIFISALVLGLGWALYVYSKRVDCHDTGCGHGPCAPKKDFTRLVLVLATVLFGFNLLIYSVFHRGEGAVHLDLGAPDHAEAGQDHGPGHTH